MNAFADLGRHPGWPARLGPLQVRAGTVELRGPRFFDGSKWSRLRIRDRSYLENWEPTAQEGWDERNAALSWPAQWSSLRGMARRGTTLPFMILVDGEVAGQITVGNIVRGSLLSAWIGYWVAADRAGGGVATAAVALLTDHAFREAGLHRLEATVRPENGPSIRVLQKSGFREEGLFKRYLDVAGLWRDHLCFALTSEEVTDGLVRRLVARGEARLP
ncbi:GNAT family protein [Lentzea sp. NBRC 102530]|uniref:GNAT family N-acetyltransferase n=1 Tax=Lentzea sp. NBRC 102530 TaxID=3032201 RepID=UPI0024A5A8AC|nr:GNAT family protein [Lentzea sp. NBRC 102530]GLY51817.1 ribosomal-protein-alanine N-acetyltransferase [Lentzea sp. NBRC 102530]